MKVWKRCLAAALAFMMFTVSVNVGEAAVIYDKENYTWNATDAEIVGKYYGFDAAVQTVLSNGALKQGAEYALQAPYPNGTENKEDLFVIDYEGKRVLAKNLYTEGMTWEPVQVVVRQSGTGDEETALFTQEICYYKDVEYHAQAAFTYSGNEYAAYVTYRLATEISGEEQTRIMNIPVVLKQTVENMEALRVLQSDLAVLANMVPYLKKMITYQVVVDEETGEKEPAFDIEEDADELAALNAIINEVETYGEFKLTTLYDAYTEGEEGILTYLLANGSAIQEDGYRLYDAVSPLRSSAIIRNIISEMNRREDPLYSYVKELQPTLRSMLGSGRNPGELAIIQESENWSILDSSIQNQIFADEYTDEEYAALETDVYRLRGWDGTVPEVSDSVVIADEITFTERVVFYDADVELRISFYNEENEKVELLVTEKFGFREGSTKDEILTEIYDHFEEDVLVKWNETYPNANINTENYEKSVIFSPYLEGQEDDYFEDGKLKADFALDITYSPKQYQIKTNYGEEQKFTAEYGQILELPKGEVDDADTSYEYIITKADGTQEVHDEGVQYKVTENLTITRVAGRQRIPYKLYELLIEDTQYTFTDDEKYVLTSSAIESPTLKIRKPDRTDVGDIVYEDGVYSITAKDYGTGIWGMSWEAATASVMKENQVLELVTIVDNKATWTRDDFTHIRINYKLKITKVANGIFQPTLDENSDILYAINLPYTLEKEVKEQNELLCGNSKTSAKGIYAQLESVKDYMDPSYLTLLKGQMKTSEGKKAVERIQKEALNENNELILYNYLQACADSNWSLASFYKMENQDAIVAQMRLLAECLDAMTKDEGFANILTAIGQGSKLEQIKALVPFMNDFADGIKKPHQAMDIYDENFDALLARLLRDGFKTSQRSTSSGIYAYENITVLEENAGCMTIEVQVGSQKAEKLEMIYKVEKGQHVITEEDAAKIQAYIAQSKESLGLTAEEEVYYDLTKTDIPTVGTTVSRTSIVSLVYSPKTYTVSILYDQTDKLADRGWTTKFTYAKELNEFEIILAPYSDDKSELRSYKYWISEEEAVEVENGTVGRSYFIPKSALTTELFAGGNFNIYKRVVIMPDVMVEADIDRSTSVIRDGYIDNDKKILCLDADPDGIILEQLEALIQFTYDGGAKPEEVSYEVRNRDGDLQHLVATGSILYVEVINRDGELETLRFEIVIKGDVNKNGKVDARDVYVMARNYLGIASESELIYDKAAKEAANVNGNEVEIDSNDALLMMQKYRGKE